MSKIIETDVVIDYLRGKDKLIINRILNHIEEGVDLKITQITAAELWYGVYRLKQKEKQISEAKKLNLFLTNISVCIQIN